MKKLLLALMGCVIAVSLAYADNVSIKAPVNDRGQAIHPMYGGYLYKHITGTTETLICSAPCLLVDLIMSTGDPTMKILIRDTDTADNGNTTYAVPEIRYESDCYAKTPSIRYPLRATYGWALDQTGVTSGIDVTVVYMTY